MVSEAAAAYSGTPMKNLAHTTRWHHQAVEFEKNRDRRSRALIWPMRSGKSRACLDVACHQFKQRKIEGAIIIAPNGVHLNWAANEVPKWTWRDVPYRTFTWETPKRFNPEKQAAWRALLGFQGLRFFAINMEALAHEDCIRAVKEFQRACHRNYMLIVSEAHHFGHPTAKRTFKARGLSHHANVVRTESGTPILTGPLRAFSQYELLAPGALGYGTLKTVQETLRRLRAGRQARLPSAHEGQEVQEPRRANGEDRRLVEPRAPRGAWRHARTDPHRAAGRHGRCATQGVPGNGRAVSRRSRGHQQSPSRTPARA